ncbi:MAG: thermonuclease family protein [Planctomycetia bacterium]
MLNLPWNRAGKSRRATSGRRRYRSMTPAKTISLVFLSFAALRILLGNPEGPNQAGNRVTFPVSYVIDGDTFELADGRRVRMLGIDAPEAGYHDKPVEFYGPESTEWLRNRIERRSVGLEITGKDSYGRTLAWVYEADGTLLNRESLSAGYSRLLDKFGLPPKLEPALRQAESEARILKKGLWQKRKTKRQQ